MKRPRITLKQLVELVAIAALIASMTLLPERKDLLVSLLRGHDTAYAPGFSERKFRGIRVGMSPAEVEAAMGGPPLYRIEFPGGEVLWRYSASPGATHHWRRSIAFSDGRVAQIHGDLYVY